MNDNFLFSLPSAVRKPTKNGQKMINFSNSGKFL